MGPGVNRQCTDGAFFGHFVQGPTRAQMEGASYSMLFVASGASGQQLQANRRGGYVCRLSPAVNGVDQLNRIASELARPRDLWRSMAVCLQVKLDATGDASCISTTCCLAETALALRHAPGVRAGSCRRRSPRRLTCGRLLQHGCSEARLCRWRVDRCCDGRQRSGGAAARFQAFQDRSGRQQGYEGEAVTVTS